METSPRTLNIRSEDSTLARRISVFLFCLSRTSRLAILTWPCCIGEPLWLMCHSSNSFPRRCWKCAQPLLWPFRECTKRFTPRWIWELRLSPRTCFTGGLSPLGGLTERRYLQGEDPL